MEFSILELKTEYLRQEKLILRTRRLRMHCCTCQIDAMKLEAIPCAVQRMQITRLELTIKSGTRRMITRA